MGSDEAKKIIATISRMRDAGTVRVLSSAQASDGLLADIAGQNCAMWIYSVGGLTILMGLGAKSGFDVTVAYMPEGETRALPTGGANLVMTSALSDNQKEAAWQFIKWMTAKRQTVTASMEKTSIPILFAS